MCNLFFTPSLISQCRSVHDTAQTILQTISQEGNIEIKSDSIFKANFVTCGIQLNFEFYSVS